MNKNGRKEGRRLLTGFATGVDALACVTFVAVLELVVFVWDCVISVGLAEVAGFETWPSPADAAIT